MQDYHHHFYASDPFYTDWKSGGDTGVYRLRAMDAAISRSRYARKFLTAMTIHDEIAVILPPIGEALPTLILDCAAKAFSAVEVAQVRRLFPVLAPLHRRHISIFVTAGIDDISSPIGQERPLRLMYHNGNQVFATDAWRIRADDAGVAQALQTMVARGPCAIRVKDHSMLRRTQLPPDFGPAPGGYCDEITAEAARADASPSMVLPLSLAVQLTKREQQVVLLTLQGHPVLEIARKISLSRGTVKNHRLAIYRKLAITTDVNCSANKWPQSAKRAATHYDGT